MVKGKFIVFEGIDGAGSTTQVNLLFKKLKSKKYKVVKTCNPSNGRIGKLIRRVLSKEFKVSAVALQLLFCADRADFLEKEVDPALKERKIVVCDRYAFSTLAYGALNLDEGWLAEIQKDFVHADITFLVDTPPKIAMERMEKRKTKDLFEKEKLLAKVRKNYLALAKVGSIVVLDGKKTKDEIAEDVLQILAERKLL